MSWLAHLFPSFERDRLRKEMQRMPRLTASSNDGDVVVTTGIVRALGAPLVAPLSHRHCTWFDSSIGPVKQHDARRFLLERDEGPPIAVELTHAHVAMPLLPQSAFDNPQTDALRVAYYEPDSPATPFETIIEIGERIWVAAVLTREVAAPPAYRDTPTDLVLAGTSDAPLVIVPFEGGFSTR